MFTLSAILVAILSSMIKKNDTRKHCLIYFMKMSILHGIGQFELLFKDMTKNKRKLIIPAVCCWNIDKK
jgi:hypothetical protein